MDNNEMKKQPSAQKASEARRLPRDRARHEALADSSTNPRRLVDRSADDLWRRDVPQGTSYKGTRPATTPRRLFQQTVKRTVHFIGMGGIGMSGIARMYLEQGYRVQGSDIRKNRVLEDLENLGAKVLIGHHASQVEGADLVVFSSSIQEDHPERAAAVKKGMKIIHRAEALAALCEGKFTIAVTGTHGKTTTTALIGMVLKEALRDPSIVVGGIVDLFGGNSCSGKGPEIVIEADESDSSFLKFSPSLEVITNIEEEHMDHFKTTERVEEAYRNFIRRLAPQGEWIGCAEDARVAKMALEKIRPYSLYGFSAKTAQFCATDIVECPNGLKGSRFVAWRGEACLGRVRLKIIGRHNVLNAMAAIISGIKRGIPFSTITQGLEKYEGARRRFEIKYEDDDYLVVDDYAHHPTEIQKTLLAAKALKKKRIFVLFQPHRYTRTQTLLEDFGGSFADADKLVVTDIYAASEPPKPGISGEVLCETIRRRGHRDTSYAERSRLFESIRDLVAPGDLLITMGAGDIHQVGDSLAGFLKERNTALAGQKISNTGCGEGIFKTVTGVVLRGEGLSRHTYIEIGGPVEFWVEPKDLEDLKETVRLCLENKKRIYPIGSGSNLLVSDRGLTGVAIHLGSPFFKKVRIEGDRIIAGAGVSNAEFIRAAKEAGLGGFEFLSGIPGTIGGAIAMNAGSRKQCIESLVRRITIVDPAGVLRVLTREMISFGYRSSGEIGGIIVEAEFCLPKVPKKAMEKKLEEYRDYRLRTQDLNHLSAGCVFKNPKSGISSGKLIEEAGLKGLRVGNAQVSEKHGNFIINLGGATAADVMTLAKQVQKSVKEKFSIDLEMELKVLA